MSILVRNQTWSSLATNKKAWRSSYRSSSFFEVCSCFFLAFDEKTILELVPEQDGVLWLEVKCLDESSDDVGVEFYVVVYRAPL